MNTKYKPVFLVFIAFAYHLYAYCQPADTTLNQPITGNQVVEATNSITFAAGFSYDAGSSNQLVATIIPTTGNSNYTFTEPQESGPLQINTNYPVGSIPGSISVGPTGAANYVIPIEIPPGRNGMKPSLSLVYNSQAGEGLLGLGWALGGLSSITRVPTNIYHEGYIDAVDFDSNDKFALDGQRLIPVGGDQYRTENETFSKITMIGSSTNPTSFKVETKDGMELYYGYTSDSRIEAQGTSNVYTWYLNQVKDKNGNYYNVNYTESTGTGEIYPASINYSCYSGNNGDYTIEFSYENRSIPLKTYINGSQVLINKLLNQIIIKYETTTVGKYQLIYVDTKLSEIIKYGANNTRLNSTNVYWGDINTGLAENSMPIISPLVNRYLGDFDGDGKTDLVIIDDNNEICSLYISDEDGQLQFQSSQSMPEEYQLSHIYHGDYNGDGLEDLMVFRLIDSNYNISFLLSNGNSFTTQDSRLIINNNSDNRYYTGDFNGNGRQDLMIKTTGTYNCKIYEFNFIDYYHYTFHNTIGLCSITWGDEGFSLIKEVPFDMNGDGKTDIMVLDQDGCRFYGLNEESRSMYQICASSYPDKNKVNLFGDYNGDGMTDIFSFDSYNNWRISISKGNGFYQKVDTTFDGFIPYVCYGSYYYNNFYSRDMNGDGKFDIVVIGKGNNYYNPTKIYIGYSNGSNFNLQSYLPISNITVSPNCGLYEYFNHFGDYNGDGVTDLYYEDGTIASLINTYRDREQYFVSEIKNGFGYSSYLSYSPLTQDSLYVKGAKTTLPVLSFQGPLYVVSSVSMENPDFTVLKTDYKYFAAHIHLQGKGFLGFEKIISQNKTTNIKSVDEYEYNPIFYNVSLKKSSIFAQASGSSSDEISSRIYYTNAVFDLGDKRYFPYIEHSVDTNYLSGVITTKDYTYDLSGNLTEYQEDYDDGSYNQTKYLNFSSAGTWLPSRPQTVKAIKKHFQDSEAFSLTGTYTYYSTTGQIHTNTAGPLTTTYEYDDYGNLTNETITDGSNSRSNHFTYDAKNMFVWKSYNALDHIIERTYDYVYGNVLTEKTPDNVVTTYTYDDFGKLTSKSTSALGISQSITYEWATDTRPLGSVYYIQETTSGAPAKKSYYDYLGRILRTEIIGFDGYPIYSCNVYNIQGQVSEKSLPHKQGETALKKDFYYDKFGRKSREESTSGSVDVNYTGKTIHVISSSGQSSSSTSDSQGNIITSLDDAGSINYVYKSIGKPISISTCGSTWSMEYDTLGRQTSLIDPDAGTINYWYNSYNELTRQVDARGNFDSLTYDNLGRVINEFRSEGTKTYIYDPSGNPGLLDSIVFPGGSTKFQYDNASRITSRTVHYDGQSFITGYGYDNYNRLQTINYPSNFEVKRVYNTYGYFSEVRRNDNNEPIWQGQNMNSFGQFTQSILGNNLNVEKTFDCLGLLRNISTDSVQDIDYSFDYETGNLNSRSDNLRNLTEIFTYDQLNRLTGVSGPASLSMTYSAGGNITSKTSIGTYTYDSQKPHAVTGVTNPEGIIPSTIQNISYTSFNMADSIIQDNLEYIFFYDYDDQRIMTKLLDNGNLQNTTYYIGEYEKHVAPGNNQRHLHYIMGGDGVAAIFVRNNSQDTMYYIHTDHLGSLDVITNQNGAVVDSFSFDAWGRRRNPADWTYNNVPTHYLFNRGFTGHEHLDQFGLINLNGRIYDPLLARIISPDNFVQLLALTQSYNRYSYALNNPLVYTDPDGEIAWFVPIIIGAAIFGTGNLTAHAIRGDVNSFGDGLKYFGQGALAGAALGAAYVFAPAIPVVGNAIHTGMNIYGAVQLGSTALSTVSGLGQGIFTGDWSALGNAGQLFLGNFYIDENKSFFGGMWQGISRHTWEYPQTLIGHSSSQIVNTLGRTRSVSYYGGATVSETYGDGWGAITLGSYIIGSRGITANPNNDLFQHEYGHYLQSQSSGLMYLSKYGIPSARSHDPHNQHPAEQDANARALTYFNRHITGYTGWNFRSNPINGYNPALGFNDPANQAAINGARLRLGWYDYLMSPLNATFIGIPIPGLINALILNRRY